MAVKIPCFKDIPQRPLDGAMDLRSPSGNVAPLDFRLCLNFTLTEERKLCRLGGWTKLFSDSPFGFLNQDLHDQLINCQNFYSVNEGTLFHPQQNLGFTYPFFYGYDDLGFFGDPLPIVQAASYEDYLYCGTNIQTRTGCREAITFLKEIKTENGSRKLIAGTKHRLSALNERTANYRLLADGLGGGLLAEDDCTGCAARRFKGATVGAVMVLTNNFDPPFYHVFDATAEGCALWSVKYIQDLADVNITQAGVVASWNGFVFLANVVQDGVRHPTRIFWSDFNNSTSWLPTTESAAGYTDLGIGEQILAMEHLGSSLIVYTDKAIYRGAFVGGDLVFRFPEIYRGDGDCLRFQNSLVNTGTAHVYGAENGIYVLAEYDNAPIRVEWIHKASGAIYSGLNATYLKGFSGLSAFGSINRNACDHFIGGYDAVNKDVWFSWPTDSNACANMSLKLNLNYRHASLVDRGFSAFLTFSPDHRPTVNDFLREWQICQPSRFGPTTIKEGEPYNAGSTTFPNPPSYIWNATEDTSLPMHPDSLSARFGQLSLQDLCDDCTPGAVFIMADAQDKTLKEFRQDVNYRERFTGSGASLDCPFTVAGTYAIDGYYSMAQGDASDLGQSVEKLINRAKLDFSAEPQSFPNSLYFQLGYGTQPDCLVWAAAEGKPLSCETEMTDDELAAANARPGLGASYPLYRRGRYLAWRFYINGTGGAACISSMTRRMRLIQGEWD